MKSVLCLGICFVLLGTGPNSIAAESPPRGMVSSAHPLATDIGLNVLKSGGNAIDAAVAVGFTLGVVDTHNSGIGGGCFMLIRLANGKFVAIDGREMAPAAAAMAKAIPNSARPARSQAACRGKWPRSITRSSSTGRKTSRT